MNWNTFNVGTGERAQFVQPNSSSTILNRVTGGLGPSQILGSIDANGRVFIVNRDGDHFRAGRGDQHRRLPGDDERHQEQRLHGRAATSSASRAGRMPRSSIRARSRRRAGASRRWWRPACATPARSRPISARSALASGNTFSLDFYGDKLITLGGQRPDRRPGEGRRDRRDAQVAGHQRPAS